MGDWIRARFHADAEDFRPVVFPPPGPYWCTGEGDGYSIVVAYFPINGWRVALEKHWPEATHLDYSEEDAPEFNGRFPKPEWWQP